jgi:hypothetical protein
MRIVRVQHALTAATFGPFVAFRTGHSTLSTGENSKEE